METCYCRGSQDHPQVQSFSRRTHRSQHIVILTAKMYYNEKIQSKISTGKAVCREVWKKPGTSFQEPTPSGVPQDALIIPAVSCNNTCEKLCAREAHQRLTARSFPWGLVT